jgi:hypothetical protein
MEVPLATGLLVEADQSRCSKLPNGSAPFT